MEEFTSHEGMETDHRMITIDLQHTDGAAIPEAMEKRAVLPNKKD
jgi:hypothetical protein